MGITLREVTLPELRRIFGLTLVLTLRSRVAFLTAWTNLHRVFGDASSGADSPAVQRRETWRCALVFGVLRGSSEISA